MTAEAGPDPQQPAFADQVSSVAAEYAAGRPRHPDARFAWLASLAHGRSLARDAGTGSQAAAGMR